MQLIYGYVGTALLMVAIIRTTDKKGFTVFKMLSKGGHAFFKSRGLETSGEVQLRILEFAQSISQKIIMNLSRWCPNKWE